MHVDHNLPTAYTMQDNNQTWNLVEVDEENDLGIFITKDLKVAKQCRSCKKSYECTESD